MAVQDEAATTIPAPMPVDGAGIERLIAGAGQALRRGGQSRAPLEPDRQAALHALALSIAAAEDGRLAATEFLGAALSLLARDRAEQALLIAYFQGEDGAAAAKAVFGKLIDPRPIIAPEPESIDIPPAYVREPPADMRFAESSSRQGTSVQLPSRSWLHRLHEWLALMRDALWPKERQARLVRKRLSDAARRISLTLPALQSAARASKSPASRRADRHSHRAT